MDTDLNLSIIAAVAENGVIGVGGELPPWNLKTDMKRFVQLTQGHLVIVGRKTHESILKRLGHSLSGRLTVVITRQKGYTSRDCLVAYSLEEVLSIVQNEKIEAFVIGGAEIYKLALPFTSTIYLTRVLADFEGDAFFPALNQDEWKETSREVQRADEKNSHDFFFITLKRRFRPGPFVNTVNARLEDQRQVMEEILKAGFCPFCPEHLTKFHKKPILKETAHWFLTENQWPYENTRIHLLAIYKKHVETLGELEPEAGKELFELGQWVETHFDLSSGALTMGMRFGDPESSGATVRHLHAQLISAAVTDRTNPQYKPVRFRAG